MTLHLSRVLRWPALIRWNTNPRIELSGNSGWLPLITTTGIALRGDTPHWLCPEACCCVRASKPHFNHPAQGDTRNAISVVGGAGRVSRCDSSPIRSRTAECHRQSIHHAWLLRISGRAGLLLPVGALCCSPGSGRDDETWVLKSVWRKAG